MDPATQASGLFIVTAFIVFVCILIWKAANEKTPEVVVNFDESEMQFKATLPLAKDESGEVCQKATLTAFEGFLNASIEYDTSNFTDRDFHLFNRLIYDAFCEGKTIEKYFTDNEMVLREGKRWHDRNVRLVKEIDRLQDENKTLYHNYTSLETVLNDKNKLVEELLARVESNGSQLKQSLDGFEELRTRHLNEVQSLRDESDAIQTKLNECEEKYQKSRSDVAELSQRITDMQSVTHEQQIKHMHDEGSRLVQIQLDRNAKLQERIRELTDLNKALAERCHGQSEALANRAMKDPPLQCNGCKATGIVLVNGLCWVCSPQDNSKIQTERFPKEEAKFVEKVKEHFPELLSQGGNIVCGICNSRLQLVNEIGRYIWRCPKCNLSTNKN